MVSIGVCWYNNSAIDLLYLFHSDTYVKWFVLVRKRFCMYVTEVTVL